MFDYKEAYCEVFEMFREAYHNLCGEYPHKDLLYALAHESAEEASRGIGFDIEEVEEIIKDKFCK